MKFPRNCNLYLTHNEHMVNYQTVAEAILEEREFDADGWISEEQKQKAIDTNDCWTIQWYPDTPIGFYRMHGADVAPLVEAACKAQEEMDSACVSR